LVSPEGKGVREGIYGLVEEHPRRREMMKCFVLSVCLISFVFSFDFPAARTVQAQTYPSRPIQLIVPNTPGSSLDTIARLLAERLGKILETEVIVVDKPGASATLGTDLVAKGKKDGYTLLYANTSAVVYSKATNPETVPYDPVKDLEPLGLHCFFAVGVFVQEKSPWKSITELLDYARKNPEKVRVGTPGVGSIDHFNIELLQSLTGARFTHVPFKGSGGHVALLGGHIEVVGQSIPTCLPHVRSGTLSPLLLSMKMQEFRNVPTLTAAGYKQELLSGWFALYGPAGISEEVKRVLVPAIEKAIKNPDLKSKMEDQGYIIDYRSPEELKKLMISDYETARAVALRIGMSK
jgi:tripartite-type tricarboxylate transporter receptor subunit TctC